MGVDDTEDPSQSCAPILEGSTYVPINEMLNQKEAFVACGRRKCIRVGSRDGRRMIRLRAAVTIIIVTEY